MAPSTKRKRTQTAQKPRKTRRTAELPESSAPSDRGDPPAAGSDAATAAPLPTPDLLGLPVEMKRLIFDHCETTMDQIMLANTCRDLGNVSPIVKLKPWPPGEPVSESQLPFLPNSSISGRLAGRKLCMNCRTYHPRDYQYWEEKGVSKEHADMWLATRAFDPATAPTAGPAQGPDHHCPVAVVDALKEQNDNEVQAWAEKRRLQYIREQPTLASSGFYPVIDWVTHGYHVGSDGTVALGTLCGLSMINAGI